MDNELREMLVAMNDKMDSMEGKIDSMEGRIGSVEGKIGSMEGAIERLDSKVSDIQERTIRIELIIENEIRPDIKKIAEGHSILNSKLNENQATVIKLTDRVDMHELHIKHHSMEIERLKCN